MLRIGQFIDNRYEILELIGSGGMADVYKAKCHKLNRIVAIKMLKEDYIDNAELVSRFQIEAQAAACLSHNNIVAIYDVGQEDAYDYIVMEYVEGKTLKTIIEEEGPLEEKEVVTIATQIAQGLAAAHQQGIIHRDIKPQNILISTEGKVKVADFGIARIARYGDTIELMPSGSVHYIAPEQARGSYCDERSDIYALGATMYEMITGQVPFDGENAIAIALAHMNDPVVEPKERNNSVSIALNGIILKCMNKKPDKRYPTVLALILDLKEAMLNPNLVIAAAPAVGDIAGKTIIMGADMVEQIKKNTSIKDNEANQADQTTLETEVEETSGTATDTEEEEEETEETTLWDKIILGLGIGFGVLILVAVVYVVASISGLWSGSNNENPVEKSSSGEAIESSSELASDETKMPSLLGLKLEDAIKLLDKNNLGYEIPKDNLVYSDEYAEDIICDQEYEEGTILKKYTKVKIKVSLGDGKFEVTEDLIGMNRQIFEMEVADLGLVITFIEEENDDYASGQIFKFEADSDTLEEGDKLTVYVSTGPSYFKMPKLMNLNEEQAVSLLKQYGLSLGEVSTDYSNTVENGMVCNQSIATGTKVKKGTRIDIVISLGRKTVTVPNIVGVSKELAVEKLRENELEIGEITVESSTTVAAGLVIRQSLEAYSKAKSGDKVDFVISSGKEERDINELIGKKESDAKGKLSGLGLKYVKSVFEYSHTVKEDCVIRVEYYDTSTKKHYVTDTLHEGDYVVLVVSMGKEEEETTTEEETTKAPENTGEEETTKAPENTGEEATTVATDNTAASEEISTTEASAVSQVDSSTEASA